MSDNKVDTKFEGWVILELMGHRRLAGKLTEATLAGGAFLRIDIPAIVRPGHPARKPFTQYYSPAAVYAITPTTEAMARAVALQSEPEPVSRWEIQAMLPAPVHSPDGMDERSEDHELDDALDRDADDERD